MSPTIPNLRSMQPPAVDPTPQLVRSLRTLPDLAAQAATLDRAGGGRTATPTRAAANTRTPRGLHLGAIDVDHGRHLPGLLARLSDCWRVVAERMREAGAPIPAAATGYDITWRSEVDQLLTWMDWWAADDWCLEWITTEVDAIRGKLIAMIDAATDQTVCQICGVRLAAHTTDTLMVAECPTCERVAGMRPRRLLTTKQAAQALGITDRGVRQQIQRGTLPSTPTTAGHVVAEDDLDWARRKLGLPAPDSDVC